jgi:hypothetical protein
MKNKDRIKELREMKKDPMLWTIWDQEELDYLLELDEEDDYDPDGELRNSYDDSEDSTF